MLMLYMFLLLHRLTWCCGILAHFLFQSYKHPIYLSQKSSLSRSYTVHHWNRVHTYNIHVSSLKVMYWNGFNVEILFVWACVHLLCMTLYFCVCVSVHLYPKCVLVCMIVCVLHSFCVCICANTPCFPCALHCICRTCVFMFIHVWPCMCVCMAVCVYELVCKALRIFLKFHLLLSFSIPSSSLLPRSLFLDCVMAAVDGLLLRCQTLLSSHCSHLTVKAGQTAQLLCL